MSEVFLDTSYAIALSSPPDQHHLTALRLSERIEANRTRIVTTHAVLFEIGNSLAKRRFRSAAVALLSALESDPSVEIVPVTDGLLRRAVESFARHRDKEWGLTDCLSFLVMRERGIADALTADDHFRQAGFRALLKETK